MTTLTAGFFAAPPAAHAQESGKVYRIGWLGHTAPTTPELRRLVEPFDQGLREFGYVEGKNLFVERRYSEGRFERLPDMAAELVRLNVDVIVAVGTPAVQAARQATRKIPIVMVAVVDPVGAGLVASLGRPGGNITGLSLLSTELSGNDWSFSRRPSLGSPEWPFSGIQPTEATYFRSKRVRLQPKLWGCAFTSSRFAVPKMSRAHFKPQRRGVPAR